MDNQLYGTTHLKKAIIYLRVSSEEQVDNFSLDTQEDICRKEAEKRGYAVLDVFREEGRSAKNISGRPVLIQMMEYCRRNKKKVHALFVYRLDRISRQTADYLAIRKKLAECEMSLISASEPTGDSPTEKFVETMLAGFAQMDNDIKSERSRNGLRARFLSGLYSTKPPLGYLLKNGYVVKDPASFDLMKKAWDLMATGTKSLNEMAKIMNDWGLEIYHNNKKHKLIRQKVDRYFRSKFYMGVLTSKRYPEEVRGQHTPMITEEQFYKVQAILDGRNPNKIALSQRRIRDNEIFPLRRIAKCGKCGHPFTGAFSKGAGGTKYAYYRCSKFCTGKSVRVETLEEEIITKLKTVTPTEVRRDLFINFIQTAYQKRQARLQRIRNDADGEIVKLQELRRQLVEKNLSGVYSDEIFKEQNAFLEERMMKAQIAKHDDIFEKYSITEITDFMKKMLADLGEWYATSSLSQKKVLLCSIFPSGVEWGYPGLSKSDIRPLYQSICTFSDNPVISGAEDVSRTHI